MKRFLLLVAVGLTLTGAAYIEGSSMMCPRMLNHVFKGCAPIGKNGAGDYTVHTKETTLLSCVEDCCRQVDQCNVAFVFNHTCYQVKCKSNELCLPELRPNVSASIEMMLVRPVRDDDPSWDDMIKATDIGDLLETPLRQAPNSYEDTVYGIPYGVEEEIQAQQQNQRQPLQETKRPYANFFGRAMNKFKMPSYLANQYDTQMEESKMYPVHDSLVACEFERDRCGPNEECTQLTPKSTQGVCTCIADYAQNYRGECVLTDETPAKLMKQMDESNEKKSVSDSDEPVKSLTVSVMSKDVTLPEKEATLSTYVIPDEKSSGDTYKYSWTLISQPPGALNGTMTDQTKDKLKLSNLSVGSYQFKVTVTGEKGSFGEADATVNVLPERRINKIPEVIITPQQLSIKLPNSKAILDGSTSKDDSEIVKYHWDLVQGPIGYQPVLPETSTLQLNDLTSPGNYTFKLTVTDSDNAQNFTTANITVSKAFDYPPEANAGPDVIVYLPKNNVTLNGSLRTDDREITAWEWTKDLADVSKAVDMQNTRTPFLELSNLEEGMYTFVLKVTDASNQSNTAMVHVFVKSPTNLPPVPNAGVNGTFNLPKTWAVLNGSLSQGNIRISQFKWTQISGPSNANLLNSTSMVANATNLTIGTYQFALTVIDDNSNNATDRVWITIVQERNTAPIANGGGDQTLTLPINSLCLNGSKSSDDLGIVSYKWERDGSSLAMGKIVGNTDNEPALILTDVVPGRYVFKLTVTDNQGLTGTDTVSVIVHPDPLVLNLVELTLTVGVTALTQSELESFEQKLVLLLGDNVKVHVRAFKMEEKTGEAVIIFYCEKIGPDGKNVVMAGPVVEKVLLYNFWRDNSILGTSISDVRTTICQNNCSNHGICNSKTRACMCETFWMPDIFYFWGLSEANCDWSILYVVIGVIILFLALSSICWGLTCLCRRSHKPRSRAKLQKYALLGTQEEEVPAFARGTSITDSDSDSDVLFESRRKPNGILRSSNGTIKTASQKVSVTRLGRQIKT